MSEISCLCLRWVIEPDGNVLLLRDGGCVIRHPHDPERSIWPSHIGVSRELIARAGELSPWVDAVGEVHPWIDAGDGFVRFTLLDGQSALYGIAHDGGHETDHYDLLAPTFTRLPEGNLAPQPTEGAADGGREAQGGTR